MRRFSAVLQTLYDAVSGMLFVRRCAVCGERICEGALCEDCFAQLRQALDAPCPSCGRKTALCRCTALDGGALAVYSLLPYRPGQMGAAERILLARKQRLDPTVEDLLSELLSPLCACAIAENGGGDGEWIITYPPRSKKKQHEVGHDQSCEMAKRLSRHTGIPMISCLERMSGSDTAQKTLGAAQRSENAQGSYVLSRRFQTDLRGKSVVIIDDIATTGATLAACASMLKEAGAVQVIALTAAKTVHARVV